MFNKVAFLQSIGLLEAKFNNQALCFERSWRLILRSKLIFLINLTMTLKMFISTMFEREDPLQIYFGSVFNVFRGAARNFLGWVVSTECHGRLKKV